MLTWYATRALLLLLLAPATMHDPRRAAGSSLCPPGYVELPGGPGPVACVMAQGTASNCTPARYDLTSDDKAKILKAHNDARLEVASNASGSLGPAADMRVLAWDDDLQKAAQSYAAQCGTSDTPQPPADRNTGSYTDVGQSVDFTAAAAAVPFDGEALVKKWVAFKIGLTSDKAKIASYVADKDTDKYAQMIWAATEKVGCGYLAFTLTPAGTNPNKALFVCNYAPAGAKVGQPVFTTGPACSKCPNGTACGTDQNKGLCETSGGSAEAAASMSKWIIPGIGIAATAVVMIFVFYCVCKMHRSHRSAGPPAAADAPESRPEEGAAPHPEEGAAPHPAEGGDGEAAGGSKEAIVPEEKKAGE
ncbi:venom allergen 5-like [Haemaphysalis longicornis]